MTRIVAWCLGFMKWVSDDPSYVTGGEPKYPQELFSAVDLLSLQFLVSMVFFGRISPNRFLSSILLVMVIIVAVVIVMVIWVVIFVDVIVGVVIVVAIIGVVVFVTIIGIVVVVGGVPSIIKLSFVIIGFLHRITLYYLSPDDSRDPLMRFPYSFSAFKFKGQYLSVQESFQFGPVFCWLDLFNRLSCMNSNKKGSSVKVPVDMSLCFFGYGYEKILISPINERMSFPFFATGVQLGPVFLLGLLALAIDAACAFRAEEMPSLISCRMAAKVMAGVSDVDVLLGGILSTKDNTGYDKDGDNDANGGNDDEREIRIKKYRGSNSSDGDNIGDGFKIAGEVIGSGDEI
ncbi:hypothetical protein Tco_1065495, partial [Tanacetum coccineum]